MDLHIFGFHYAISKFECAWNGSSHLWIPPCNFLKNIEMEMTLVKMLIRSELLQKDA